MTRRSGRVRSAIPRAVLALVILCVGVALEPRPAGAILFSDASCPGFDDPFAFPPPTCVSIGNNYTHTYQFVGVRSDIVNSFNAVIEGQYDGRTDLDIFQRNPADVVVQDHSYGQNNLVGWVNCPPNADEGGAGQRRWCYGQYLRFNLSYLYLLDSVSERQDVSCHEFGHTVGLQHTFASGTCMNNDGSWGGNLTISATEVGEINNVYLPY